ncbi:MAG: desulfoferrodoxin [Fretibacterium sp.]|uniref:desulfoferrodoxin n=1 Tax=Fretibacterium sp. OH1220_COT-178 TaxID=2491047 RepID=UPI0018F60AF0|nr:desulfoferrodoxin [Fretibacterium sp. OH1220_COT-178]MDO4785423.1 desulfoferrodoxin [Fretibacterium sp.]
MERLSILKCDKCGCMVEVLNTGCGEISCCGDAMKLLKENTTDAAQEKHVPVFEGSEVKVGSVAHPMAEEHYIEWIEVICGDKICRRFLKPGEEPKAEFSGSCNCSKTIAREYCNLHGLWKGEK